MRCAGSSARARSDRLGDCRRIVVEGDVPGPERHVPGLRQHRACARGLQAIRQQAVLPAPQNRQRRAARVARPRRTRNRRTPPARRRRPAPPTHRAASRRPRPPVAAWGGRTSATAAPCARHAFRSEPRAPVARRAGSAPARRATPGRSAAAPASRSPPARSPWPSRPPRGVPARARSRRPSSCRRRVGARVLRRRRTARTPPRTPGSSARLQRPAAATGRSRASRTRSPRSRPPAGRSPAERSASAARSRGSAPAEDRRPGGGG